MDIWVVSIIWLVLNNAVMDILVYIFQWTYAVELLGHWVGICLALVDIAKQFPQVGVC